MCFGAASDSWMASCLKLVSLSTCFVLAMVYSGAPSQFIFQRVPPSYLSVCVSLEAEHCLALGGVD